MNAVLTISVQLSQLQLVHLVTCFSFTDPRNDLRSRLPSISPSIAYPPTVLDQPTAMETVCPPSVSSPNAASVIRTRSQLKKPSEAADSSNEHTVRPARSNKAAKSARSNQATDSHTQTGTRSNALIVSADKPNESARPQSEEHHSTPITNGLPVPEERSLTASQPDTSTEEPYSAIDSPEPPVSPESIEEFNSNRRQAIRANNKKVYANGNWRLLNLVQTSESGK